MPVNYQQVKAQIQSLGADAVQQRQALIDRLAQAEALLAQHANDLERWWRRAEFSPQTWPLSGSEGGDLRFGQSVFLHAAPNIIPFTDRFYLY